MFVTLVTTSCGQTVNFPTPSLTAVSPTSITTAQTNPFVLTVIGGSFVQQSTIEWNSTALVTVFVNTSQLTATIPPSLYQAPGTATITVVTPQPGGGTTQGILFTISPTVSPVPSISSLSPSGVLTGGAGVELQVMGTNFVAQSAVAVNGSRRLTTFVNSTLVETALTASDIATPGVLEITVINPVNPPPGGGSSNTFPLNILNPFPTITAVSPASAQAGTAPDTLTVTGTGFVGSQISQIAVNGVLRPTTFASSTSLTTPLTGSDLLVAGVDQITVVTSTPGGGTSNILTFPVTPTHLLGLPVLLDLAPNGAQANAGICGGMLSCDDGTPPKFTTVGPSTSTTGQYVAFASISNNLITNEANNGGIIFIRNTCVDVAGCIPVTAAISTDPNGNPANGPSSEPAINAAASDVVFTSTATNLVTSVGAPGDVSQVYWRPTCLTANCVVTPTTFVTQIISISADGLSAGNGDSYNPAISPDGEWVAFISLATNLVSNVTLDGVTPQVFLRETCGGMVSGCTPTTFLVSTPDGITPGNGPSSNPAVSEGGLYVSFTSIASNLGATAPNPSGAQEIFQRSTCVENTCTANTILISTPDGVTPADGASSESSISSTGQFVAFASTATNLEAGVGPTQQIYSRNTCLDITTTCTPSTTLISSTNGGIPGNGTSEYPSISSTGQYIAFASFSSNFASTTNGVENIFVNNTCVTSTTVALGECTVSTALVTQGAGTPATASNGNSLVPSISPDGTTVSFLSFASNLVPRDNNGLEDIFLGSTSFAASTVEFTPQGAMRSAAARRSSQ
jgi:Tol biopolymer transport system component